MATQAQRNRIARLEQKLSPLAPKLAKGIQIWRQNGTDTPLQFRPEVLPGEDWISEEAMLAQAGPNTMIVIVAGDWERSRQEQKHAALLRSEPPPAQARTIPVNRPSTVSQPRLTAPKDFSEFIKGD